MKDPEKPPDKDKNGFWSQLSALPKLILIALGFLLIIILMTISGVSAGVIFGIVGAVVLIMFLLRGTKKLQNKKPNSPSPGPIRPKITQSDTDPSNSLQNTPKRFRSSTPSSIEIINPEDIDITMDDIAGNEEAKREVQQVLEFLQDPKRLSKFGGKIPKGTLFWGPPGTGKTMLAKAVAKTAGRPFIMPTSSSFAEIYVGTGPKRVKELFETARRYAPSIIFIDEIDALGKRGESRSGGEREGNNTLNEILKQMDGFSSMGADVVVFGATNRIDTLDPALLRPGRFDRHIKVDLPDPIAREAIFEVHLRQKSRDAGIKYKQMYGTDVNVKSLARITSGCSGADIANIVNEACIEAGDEDADCVEMKHFTEAFDKVMTGTKRRNLLSEEEKERVAYHESGHALVGYLLPDANMPQRITIIGRDRSLGHTWLTSETDKQLYQDKHLKSQLATLVGGRIAEEIKYPGTRSTGGGNDYERANEIAYVMVTKYGMAEDEELQSRIYGADKSTVEAFTWSDETKKKIDVEINKLLKSAEKLAKQTLVDNIELFEKFTRHLLEVETMDEDEIEKAVRKFSPKDSIKGRVLGTIFNGKNGNGKSKEE